MVITSLACGQDNYVWVLHESETGKTAIVDPSEAKPVAQALDDRQGRPDAASMVSLEPTPC